MKVKKVWWIFRQGQQWDGPHFTEQLADQACLRARADGYGLVYVERVIEKLSDRGVSFVQVQS